MKRTDAHANGGMFVKSFTPPFYSLKRCQKWKLSGLRWREYTMKWMRMSSKLQNFL